MAKKEWSEMSPSEKTIGIVAVGVVALLIIWFVIGSMNTEPKTIDDKIQDNADAVIQEQRN